MFNIFLSILFFAPFLLCAQAPPQLPPGGLIQLQVAQPPVDVSSPATAMAMFDPPVARVGEKVFYRVTVKATESSIQWPEKIPAPVELKFSPGARGQMTQFQGNKFRAVSAFTYEVQVTAAGHFSISNFTVTAGGGPVEIPAATLEVVADNSVVLPAARRLMLQVSETNVFLGQPVRIHVLLPAAQKNEIEALREIQFNGNGLMTDKMSVRQSVEVVNHDGQLKPAFIYETTAAPIAAGPLKFSAQAFTAGREFGGPLSIHSQVTLPGGPTKYIFLTSDPIELNVRPLPTENELPGFTGAMGKFTLDKVQLSTNRIHIGEPVQLKFAFHGEGGLTRFVPPEAPRLRDWQIIADKPPASGFTLIPLTDEVHETPVIPFCAFDPATGKFVDLTIPPLPITIAGENLPTELPALDEGEKNSAPLKLSGFAPTPGKTMARMEPLQLRGWFIALQFVPVLGFILLWQWGRRRRFLEAHPEIVRRQKARRALRQEKIKLQKAVTVGDADKFVQHAVNAMKIACAPHFPAHPQALVCGDVLSQLDDARQNGPVGETVRKVFAAADLQFASASATPADLLALYSDVENILQKLEEKL